MYAHLVITMCVCVCVYYIYYRNICYILPECMNSYFILIVFNHMVYVYYITGMYFILIVFNQFVYLLYGLCLIEAMTIDDIIIHSDNIKNDKRLTHTLIHIVITKYYIMNDIIPKNLPF